MAFDPITAVADLGKTLIERLIPDKAAQDQAKNALAQMQVQGELAQIAGQLAINQTEAANQSTFVAGWRPAIGWVCASALGCDFVVRPLFNWGVALWGRAAVWPALDMSSLMPLMLGMLGLGAYRTYEKVSGVQK